MSTPARPSYESGVSTLPLLGDTIGANLDPSHLFWQGIDVIEAIRVLGRERAIYHVHAKDTAIDPHNAGRFITST